jgi:hypothetical protein
MGNLLLFVNLVCLVLTIMVIWFKSAAFVEYVQLLGLKTLLLGYDKDPNNLTFPQYLYVKSKSLFKSSVCRFLVALITCPLCLAFWLSIGVACLYGTVLLTPLFYIAVLVSYFLIERILG